MMDNNSNFLLKIHMEEENTTEIFLNKERHTFTFVDDDCISDLIVPEFKITSLNMMLGNVVSTSGDEKVYAEYVKDNETVREYDRDKINILKDLVTKINISDFVSYIDNIKINDFYVDSIVDKYNVVLPKEVQKIISYTTNGTILESSDIYYLMSHEDIMEYNGPRSFVPFMIKDGKNYIGYDTSSSTYKEILDDKVINEASSLKELVLYEEIEVLDAEEDNEAIKNIDLQIDRLDSKKVEEESAIADEIRKGVLDSLDAIDKEENIEKVTEKVEEVSDATEETDEIEDIDLEEALAKISMEEVNDDVENINFEEEQPVAKENIITESEKLEPEEVIEQEVSTEVASENINQENDDKDKINNPETTDLLEENLEEVVEEKQEEVAVDEETTKNDSSILESEDTPEENNEVEDIDLEDAFAKISMDEITDIPEEDVPIEVASENADVPEENLKVESEISTEEQSKEEIDEKAEEPVVDEVVVEDKVEQEENEKTEEIIENQEENSDALDPEEVTSLNNLIDNAIVNSFDNYQINFNDTGELVVEHLPYYELPKQFDVITIPEVEIDKITLLPNNDIDFGKFKLTVTELNDNKVTFTVKSASSIVLEDGTKVKKGDNLTLDLKTTLDLRLKKKDVMETWSLKMEKSTFEKELRNIDYNRIMNYIYGLDAYKDLEYVEKFELQKSVMLFVDFIMRDKEEDKLEELYRILEKEPTLYEEYITNYNVTKAVTVKDELNTYEDKKEFVAKLNYITGLSKAKWLDYPRYIFASHDYFSCDEFLQEFNEELENSVDEKDFATYLNHLFKKYDMFNELDEEGQGNLDNCLDYLSKLYKYHSDIGENNKYRIEKEFMTGATEEDMALLISKLCRRGIKDYASFVEYDRDMKEKYRLGELKYPIFSPEFGDCDMRKDGENDEF